jgi:hypothetical protein
MSRLAHVAVFSVLLLLSALWCARAGAQALRSIDEGEARSAGIRKIVGQRLTLYTDLPASPEIDSLPALFDQAYPQWCDYFRQPQQSPDEWHTHGFLMRDKNRFLASGLLPRELPPFPNGYAIGRDMWLYEQPTEYYRRHLLLHEGTHAYMNTILGGGGVPWYAEGMAELLATHRLADGKLTLDYFPRNRDEVSQLGRIKLVRDRVAAGSLRTLPEILAFGPNVHLENEPYAWCWALAALLDGDLRYRDRFRSLGANIRLGDFNDRFEKLFAADWDELCDQWEVFACTLEHGHDLVRSAIQFAPGEPLPPAGRRVTIAADRGWQSTGLRLEQGVRYRLQAKGRYQLATQPRVWESEPNGVSIRYYGGQPLGILQAAVRPEIRSRTAHTPLVRPQAIGLGAAVVPEATGTLYLRINDSPAELADNRGTLDVTVAKE